MSDDNWANPLKAVFNDFFDWLYAFFAADDEEYIGTGRCGEVDADIRITVKLRKK